MTGHKAFVLGLAMLAAACQQSAAAPVPPAEPGKQLYDRWCGTCHARGARMPGTLALEVKYGGRRPAVLEEAPVNRDLVAYVVRNGIGAMPRFRKTEISDSDLALIAGHLAGDAHSAGGAAAGE